MNYLTLPIKTSIGSISFLTFVEVYMHRSTVRIIGGLDCSVDLEIKVLKFDNICGIYCVKD